MVLCPERRFLGLRTDLLTSTEECSLLRASRLVVVFLISGRDSGRLPGVLLLGRILDVFDSPGFLPVILILRPVRVLPAIEAFWVSLRVLVAMSPTLFRLPVTMVLPIRDVLGVFVRPPCGFFGFSFLIATAGFGLIKGFAMRSVLTVPIILLALCFGFFTGEIAALLEELLPVTAVGVFFGLTVRPVFDFGGFVITARRDIVVLVWPVFGLVICLRLGCEGVVIVRVLIFLAGWGELGLGWDLTFLAGGGELGLGWDLIFLAGGGELGLGWDLTFLAGGGELDLWRCGAGRL